MARMAPGRAHLSVITLAALMLGALAAWGALNYVRAPKLTPELRGYRLAEDLGCHGCHGPRGVGGVPNIGTQEGEIPAWDGGMALMYVKDEKEIREWILDGRPWRLVINGDMVDFLNWMLDQGQGMVSQLNYAPLPKEVVERDAPPQ